ncbi:MAG: cell division protein SepF [Clostridia bacterium]|nr:cell division protein SepF [Clostridia bacterium]
MGLFEKLKRLFTGTEDEEYDDYDQETDFVSRSSERHSERRETTTTDSRRNKVVNIHATTQLQVVLVKPERFDDSSSIADHLNEKRTVVLNLESASKDVSRRILDFLSGVAYANDGQIKRVANATYIITPSNIGVMGDLLDELENNGLYF